MIIQQNMKNLSSRNFRLLEDKSMKYSNFQKTETNTKL